MSSDRVDGNNNIIAGRDVIILDDLSLSEKVRQRLIDIDVELNSIFPNRILSPTKNNAFENFESTRMIQSLSKIGIPIEAAIEVIENIKPLLYIAVEEEDRISTATLRRVVTKSIYGLDASKFGLTTLQEWGDRYARRYGDPDSRIIISHKDGTFDNFDYKFVQSQLLPHLIGHILKCPFEKVLGKYLNNSNLRFMTENIIEHVKSMNLYKMQYKTLFYLSKDLATQPPHPWFVEEHYLNNIVKYDLERARRHNDQIPVLWNRKEISSCWHSTNESIYHSCSSILAYYGAILGGAELSTLHHLIKVLELCEKRDFSVIWDNCKISQIEGDFNALGKSIPEVLRLLNRTLKHCRSANPDSLKHLIKHAEEIMKLATDIVSGYVKLTNMLNQHTINQLTHEDSKNLVLTLFKKFFKYNKVHENDAVIGYWMIHNIDTPVFREIKPEILIVPLTNCKDQLNINELCRLIIESLEYRNFANTVIFVSCCEETNCACNSSILNTFLHKYTVPILGLLDLIGICKSEDRIEDLERAIIGSSQ